LISFLIPGQLEFALKIQRNNSYQISPTRTYYPDWSHIFIVQNSQATPSWHLAHHATLL